MGIRFRKSIGIGPVRVNLSKSGIGYSVGVKGARVGKAATGRVYTRGGSHGVYFDETIGRDNSTPTNLATEVTKLVSDPSPTGLSFLRWLALRIAMIFAALMLLMLVLEHYLSHR